VRRPMLILLAVAAIAASAFTTPVTLESGPAVLTRDPGPGYFATSNIEWLGNIPVNTDSAGARFLDGYLYITEDRGLTIYDLSDPELPVPAGFHPLPQGPYYTEEDVDTNGEILLIGSYGDLAPNVGPLRTLYVFDVTNKNLPTLIGQVAGADQHTVSCILDCTWAYGSGGNIVDLRDPTSPVLQPTRWTQAPEVQAAGVNSSHDVTEVAPGIVVTSSNPVLVLDAREDPVNPKVVATGSPGDGRFIHGNLWKNGGVDEDGLLVEADDLLLVGGETFSSACGENDGAFMTFDAREVNAETEAIRTALADGEPIPERTAGFSMLDQWRVSGSGLYADGNSPYNQYCAHWFTQHPTWDDGGLLAMGWYEHGVRFLEVASEADADADPDVGFGDITEKGWFVPLGGSTSAAYWVTDEIVYTADYQRGIDILRFTDEPASDELTMVGQAQAVADRDVDPDRFFPWFGVEARLAVLDRTGLETSGGFVGCRIPVTQV